VRLPHVAHLLELREDVADRGRREIQPSLVRKRRRRDWFTRLDVGADEAQAAAERRYLVYQQLAEMKVPAFEATNGNGNVNADGEESK